MVTITKEGDPNSDVTVCIKHFEYEISKKY